MTDKDHIAILTSKLKISSPTLVALRVQFAKLAEEKKTASPFQQIRVFQEHMLKSTLTVRKRS